MPGDLADWTRFSFSGGRLQAQLIGLKTDLQLVLTDAEGDLIAWSAERGNKSEKVVADLSPGIYHVGVFRDEASAANSADYRVNVTPQSK